MPRNVVTLVPRKLSLPTRHNRERRAAILARLGEAYRPRDVQHGLEIDFPTNTRKRVAKEAVAAELDRFDPRWRRLFVLYPSENSLRERE